MAYATCRSFGSHLHCCCCCRRVHCPPPGVLFCPLSTCPLPTLPTALKVNPKLLSPALTPPCSPSLVMVQATAAFSFSPIADRFLSQVPCTSCCPCPECPPGRPRLFAKVSLRPSLAVQAEGATRLCHPLSPVNSATPKLLLLVGLSISRLYFFTTL